MVLRKRGKARDGGRRELETIGILVTEIHGLSPFFMLTHKLAIRGIIMTLQCLTTDYFSPLGKKEKRRKLPLKCPNIQEALS